MSPLDWLISKLKDLLGFGSGTTLTQEQADALARYGGYQLQLGDDDTYPPVYEGSQRTPPEPLPAPGADGFVTVLQKDLQQLGFDPALVPNGKFDRVTSWLLREFQIYASTDTVATEAANVPGSYADRLTGTANAQKYQGDISGRLDGATAAALHAWSTNNYRCPVVAETRDQSFNLIKDNIWFPPEDQTNGHLCWVTDLTGTYQVDPQRLQAQLNPADPSHRRILSGSYTTEGLGGPVCQSGTVWTNSTIPQCTNITIGALTGDPLRQASAQTVSTYKVIRAVAQVETLGNFEAVNCWDRARASIGIFHFSLHDRGHQTELPAFLSFLASVALDDYNAAFARYGIDPDEDWSSGVPPVSNGLYDSTSRNWTAHLRQSGLETWPGLISVARNPIEIDGDADYFTNWHWLYRWVMAGRLFPNIWTKSWDFGRYRLQALLDTPCPAAGLPTGTALRDVYTSEYAVTALLRVHVNYTPAVIAQGIASSYITNSIANAFKNDPTLGSLSTWTNDQHKKVDGEMISFLLAAANDPKHLWPYRNDLMKAVEYSSDVGSPPSLNAGTFQLAPPP